MSTDPRIVPMNVAVGSRARSIQANYPFYPAPVYPVETEVKGGFAGFSHVSTDVVDERTDKGIVNRALNRWGDRVRYTYGAVRNTMFHMRATGQVESTEFQPYLSYPLNSTHNDWLYRAAKGYPQNLGLSEKVPTIPAEALGNNPWGQMTGTPRFTRSVFTRRSFVGAPSVPAQPQAH